MQMDLPNSIKDYANQNHPTLIITTILLLLILGWILKASTTKQPRLPPGPPGWPVIGNILDLGTLAHQNLHNLRPKYGPVIWLQLGLQKLMVIQSPAAAADFFKNHDVHFADRLAPQTLTALDYNQGSMAVGNYGGYWRLLRRICSMELLANKRVNETAAVREKCIDSMIQKIKEAEAVGPGEIQIGRYLFLMTFNLVGNLVLSRDLIDTESKVGNEFLEAMTEFFKLANSPNLADFFPFLQRLDPQGMKRRMEKQMGRVLKITSGFVRERKLDQEHKRSAQADEKKKDLLDVLLEHEGDSEEGADKISEKNINILILEMFLAGSETTSTVIEWGMSELLHNPTKLKMVREELDRVIGPKRKLVTETDLNKLPYLQAAVKETLRLHPPLPFLITRNAMQDTEYMGYFVPKDTKVLVNAWSIGRDADSWDDPFTFKPERFLVERNNNIDYKGHNYELIPFGSGRRICAGFFLAHRVVLMAIANLVHSFDWEVYPEETIDMREMHGSTLRKLVPLKAIPKLRTTVIFETQNC